MAPMQKAPNQLNWIKNALCITLHIEGCIMRTNIVLDDNLMDEAFWYSPNVKTKRELIETALKEYVVNRKRKDLRDLKGQIIFDTDYAYKAIRKEE